MYPSSVGHTDLRPDVDSDLSWLTAKQAADSALFHHNGKYLTDIEVKVLQGAWDGKTYDEMAILYGYSSEYLNKDIGNKLWKKLSDALNERVTKRNFREALKRAWKPSVIEASTIPSSPDLPPLTTSTEPLPVTQLAFPEGAVALDSPLYLERSGIEPLCYQSSLKPGALIRIKAPKLMGKTSLIHRILAYAESNDCRVVYLDLSSCDRAILADLDKFLRWLCLMASRQLKLTNRLPEYWDTEILGSNDNCTAYFEEYLLPDSERPLVLSLDDCDRLFTHAEVAEDALGMLRSWHEKGKISSLWQQLRLVMAHSTEVYIPLDINQSPFNAGLPVELQEFDLKQVEYLTQLHGLSLPPHAVLALMQMIGGHPYLVCLALYTLCTQNITLEHLLANASTEVSIYSGHLRRHLERLHQSPDLLVALQQVVMADAPIALDSMQTYKLHSMGLVQQRDNHVMPRCQLYQDYFRRVLTN